MPHSDIQTSHHMASHGRNQSDNELSSEKESDARSESREGEAMREMTHLSSFSASTISSSLFCIYNTQQQQESSEGRRGEERGGRREGEERQEGVVCLTSNHFIGNHCVEPTVTSRIDLRCLERILVSVTDEAKGEQEEGRGGG
jgi:hypothetical protein